MYIYIIYNIYIYIYIYICIYMHRYICIYTHVYYVSILFGAVDIKNLKYLSKE